MPYTIEEAIRGFERTLTNKETKARTGLSVRQIQRILKADDQGDYAR